MKLVSKYRSTVKKPLLIEKHLKKDYRVQEKTKTEIVIKKNPFKLRFGQLITRVELGLRQITVCSCEL